MMNKNFKNGFSLAQLMVTLLVLSILLAAATPLITRAHKKIPTKALHGMYRCYYDDNENLTQEYYNSKTRISQNIVNECSFRPPREAASFKVELYGGGAGGNYSFDITDELGTKREAKYNPENGSVTSEDNTIMEPPDEIIKELYDGVTITVSAPTGSGEKGGDLQYEAAFIQNAVCRYNAHNSVKEHPDVNTKFQNKVKSSYPDEKQVINTVSQDLVMNLRNLCMTAIDNTRKEINQKDEDILTDIDKDLKKHCNDNENHLNCVSNVVTVLTKKTIEGLKGAPNRFLTYSYEISIPENVTDVKDYIKKQISNTTPGKCSDANCNEFIGETIPIGNHTTTTKKTKIVGENSYFGFHFADNGNDQTHWAAIKIDNGAGANPTYIIANDVAKGGAGASFFSAIPTNDTSPVFVEEQALGFGLSGYRTDALPVSGAESTDASITKDNKTHIPVLDIDTQVNIRTYTYGLNGEKGQYISGDFAQLSDGCDIKVGKGGAAGTEDNHLGSRGENTTFRCTNPTISLSATGGSAKSDNGYQATKDLDFFILAKQLGRLGDIDAEEIDFESIDIEFPIKDDTVDSETNNNNQIFTRFKSTGTNTNFGTGGAGTTIIDKLLKAWGNIKYSCEGENIEDNVTEKPSDDDIENAATVTPPSAGSSGAVIITW